MKKCQMTMYDGSITDHYFECGKPAKFTIVDRLRGRLFICGIHANSYTKIAKRLNKPLPEKLT